MEFIKQELIQHNRIVLWICRIMVAISAVTLGIMLCISVADVAGRFFFLHPITGTFELVGILMVVIGFLGLGYCQLMKGNISIDIFTNRFGRRGQAVLNILSYTMSIIICVLIVWQGSLRVHEYYLKVLGGQTETLAIPFWPFMLLMAIGFAWVTIIFIIDLVNAFIEVFRK